LKSVNTSQHRSGSGGGLWAYASFGEVVWVEGIELQLLYAKSATDYFIYWLFVSSVCSNAFRFWCSWCWKRNLFIVEWVLGLQTRVLVSLAVVCMYISSGFSMLLVAVMFSFVTSSQAW